MGTHPIFQSDFDCLTDCLKMPYSGQNSQGNNYTRNNDGSWWYSNQNGSHYSERGNHQHYTNPSGNGGWHHNSNTGHTSSGQYYRDTNRRNFNSLQERYSS